MSWIEEIRHDVRTIKTAPNVLRKFGITVGSLFVLFSIYGMWKEWEWEEITITVGTIGFVLFIVGLSQPPLLRSVHYYWMAFAIILGSIVSRIILTFVYFVILTPVSVLARLAGKQFFYYYQDKSKKSYWIERDNKKKIHYERM